MNDLYIGEVVDDESEFFAPVASDLIDGLIGQYQDSRRRVEAVVMTEKELTDLMRKQFDAGMRHAMGYMPAPHEPGGAA